jgi:hypothetical protein
LLGYSSQVFAVRDYKCYIQLSEKKSIIKNQFARSPEDAKAKILKRLSKKANKSINIDNIQQCIKVQANFSSYEAQQLDLLTPQ